MFHYKAAIYDFYTESTAACTLLEHSNIGIDVYIINVHKSLLTCCGCLLAFSQSKNLIKDEALIVSSIKRDYLTQSLLSTPCLLCESLDGQGFALWYCIVNMYIDVQIEELYRVHSGQPYLGRAGSRARQQHA